MGCVQSTDMEEVKKPVKCQSDPIIVSDKLAITEEEITLKIKRIKSFHSDRITNKKTNEEILVILKIIYGLILNQKIIQQQKNI